MTFNELADKYPTRWFGGVRIWRDIRYTTNGEVEDCGWFITRPYWYERQNLSVMEAEAYLRERAEMEAAIQYCKEHP